ncbi:hypothetical protein PFISCL1PPCAC_15551, partial [Pristionchus fissidentatus]
VSIVKGMVVISPEKNVSSFLGVDTLSPPPSSTLPNVSPASVHGKTSLDLSYPHSWNKRGSMPVVTSLTTRDEERVKDRLPPIARGEERATRRFSIARVEKAVDDFKDRRSKSSSDKPSKGDKTPFTSGFASLTNSNKGEDGAGCWSEPVNCAMKAENCEQLVGRTAEEYLEGLNEKQRNALRKTIENDEERKEEEYFMWMSKGPGTKMAVVSVKCVENYLSGQRGRRVKWRNISTGRVSIYRYSIAVIPIGFGTRVARWIRKHRKLCLILVWLSFVALICLTVVVGSIGNESPADGSSASNPNARIG